MRTRLLPALVAAIGLGGCAMHHHHHGDGGPRAMHANPLVTVKGNYASVSPDPLVFLSTDKPGRITWRLAGGATFPANGIVVNGQVVDPEAGNAPVKPSQYQGQLGRFRLNAKQSTIDDCRRDDERTYSCENRRGAPGVFKYTITVDIGGRTVSWDPTVMND